MTGSSAGEAFLGVSHSLTGRRWQRPVYDERLALTISQRLNLPEVVGRVLAARHVSLEEAEGFLSPTLRDLFPDPFHLLDMKIAAERLAQAVRQGETIGVFGDYDVDGATSSALLIRYFRTLGVDVRFAHSRPSDGRIWPQRAGTPGDAETGGPSDRHGGLRGHVVRTFGRRCQSGRGSGGGGSSRCRSHLARRLGGYRSQPA